jgi:CHAT domain-containing protein
VDGRISGLFVTSQPRAPHATPIPGTTDEVASIYAAAQGAGVRVSKVEGDSLTVEGCLQHMEDFSSVHLACHAIQSAPDPLQSRFRFHNGSLELGKIIQKNLRKADLAFLSACQTSAGEETLSDEAVHLAAGMLAAGYRRVVATMWAISDRHAPAVANDFYQYLWDQRKEDSGGGFDGSMSAHALHHAVQKLRERLVDDSEESLLAWAPYVHFGY